MLGAATALQASVTNVMKRAAIPCSCDWSPSVMLAYTTAELGFYQEYFAREKPSSIVLSKQDID